MTELKPSAFQIPAPGLVIGGRTCMTASAGMAPHLNSYDGTQQAEVPLAGRAEVDEAVAAAKAALPGWRATPPAVRRDLLFRLADLVDRDRDYLVWLGAKENGTPVKAMQAIPDKFISWTKYAAGWADKLEGRVISTFQDDTAFDFTIAEPYGVIGMIMTWNGPLMGLGMKMGPALAVGNTVVMKPPEIIPFTAFHIMKLVEEAGFPEGVVNLVTGGVEAGEALVTHEDVAKIAFTGGTQTAARIAAAIAPQIKPAIYELGGKSANVIFADADMAVAVEHAARRPMFQSGQGCILPTRILVERPIVEEFQAAVVAELGKLKVGDPMDAETDLGPVIHKGAQARLLEVIGAAKERGDGRLVTGGGVPEGQPDAGAFVEATLFGEVKPQSVLAQEECFGPVLSVIPFDTVDEAVEIANGTKFGLGAYVHTSDLNRALQMAHRLVSGNVLINGAPTARENAPFGGLGASGHGREGGRDGVQEFIRIKNVAINRI